MTISTIPATFNQAKQQFSNIEAIDYYLAKQLMLSFDTQSVSADSELLFVLFMALSESLRQGHSCLPLNVIANIYWGRASDSDNIITHQGYLLPSEQCLTELLTQVNQGVLLANEHKQPIVFWHNCLYLRRYFCFEQELASFIKPRLALSTSVDMSTIQQSLAQVFSADDFSVKSESELDWQMLSVANALNKKFTIVAGGPGTGKTYTVTKYWRR